MAGESSPSYNHDAEVIVFNYKTRATEPATFPLAPGPLNVSASDAMATDKISLRDAIIGIQCQKSKSQPHGTFALTLKPTQEWTKVLVPGSWCAIFMSNQTLKTSDLTNGATSDPNSDNIFAPLKMIGMIMAVRTQKKVDGNGAVSLTYTVTGYDFGYALLSSVYINHTFQQDVVDGLVKGPFSNLNFPTDDETYGDPALNVQRVLQGWSIMSSGGVPGNIAGDINPPSIRMIVPDDVASFMGTGNEILQFISACIGVDQRSSKTVNVGDDGQSDDFTFKLIGEKFFMIWQLIVNNTLWGMINQYLNPILNEAYCDLHCVAASAVSSEGLSTAGLLNQLASGSGLSTAGNVKPLLVVRQIPFNTPQYDDYWNYAAANAGTTQKYEVTKYVNLPSTTIPAEKVLSFDIGYSDYERINFVEVNGFDKDLSKHSPGAFNDVNIPKYEEGAIKRFGLRPKVIFGADYGAVRGNIAETGYWSPLLMDWWFNSNKYANGTVECVGLLEHIALGENFELEGQNILAHIESYTHTFHVDSKGNRIFRTTIDFVRGIAADSTETKYNYIYGDQTFGGAIPVNPPLGAQTQDPSIFQQDVTKRVSFTSVRPQK